MDDFMGKEPSAEATVETQNTLDLIRIEELANAGFWKEATAISATRVAIDKLRRTYAEMDMCDVGSMMRFEVALWELIGKPKEGDA